MKVSTKLFSKALLLTRVKLIMVKIISSFNIRIFVAYRYHIDSTTPSTLDQVSYYCTVSFIFFVLCVTLLYSIPVISKCCQKRKTGTRRRQLINELISCVGGGALLGLALLDVLPELRERIEEETEVTKHSCLFTESFCVYSAVPF